MKDIIALAIRPNGAAFDFGDNEDAVARDLDALIERYETEQLKPARYVAALREFITRHPNYVEASAHLAHALLDQDKPRQALEAALRGFRIGEKAIPADFRGVIAWRDEANRGFLAVADALAHAHVANGEHAQALAVMEKMLAWNPDDQQGVTFRIGALHLRVGDKEKARAAFEATRRFAGSYAQYGLGLLHILEGEFAAAATALRRAFVDSPYPAELLCGAVTVAPFRVGDDVEEAEQAMDFIDAEGDLWTRDAQAIPFLRWLYHHPKAMLERAAIFDLMEQRHWEKNLNARDALEQREQELIASIDDALSSEIVRERENEAGERAMPWMHLASAPPDEDAPNDPAWLHLQ